MVNNTVWEGFFERCGTSEHSADNLLFLKGTSDFLRENKCIQTYYFRPLQHRLGLSVPLSSGKLSTEFSETPHRSETPSLTLMMCDSCSVPQHGSSRPTQSPQMQNVFWFLHTLNNPLATNRAAIQHCYPSCLLLSFGHSLVPIAHCSLCGACYSNGMIGPHISSIVAYGTCESLCRSTAVVTVIAV